MKPAVKPEHPVKEVEFRLLASPDHSEWPLGEVWTLAEAADVLGSNVERLKTWARCNNVVETERFAFAVLTEADPSGLDRPLRSGTLQYPRFQIIQAPSGHPIFEGSISLPRAALLLRHDLQELERMARTTQKFSGEGYVVEVVRSSVMNQMKQVTKRAAKEDA